MQFQTPPEPVILDGNKKKLRWAVGAADGPRSHTWVVSAHRRAKDDQHNVYVGTEQHMGKVKLSLHEPSIWQIGYTREYAHNRWPGLNRSPLSTFTPPPELAPGWKRAAAILIPTTSLTEREVLPAHQPRAVQLWPAPPPTQNLQFHVLISETSAAPSIELTRITGAVGVIRFGSRWSVCVVARPIVLNRREHAHIEAQRGEARAEGAEGQFAWGVIGVDGTPHLIDL